MLFLLLLETLVSSTQFCHHYLRYSISSSSSNINKDTSNLNSSNSKTRVAITTSSISSSSSSSVSSSNNTNNKLISPLRPRKSPRNSPPYYKLCGLQTTMQTTHCGRI